jgi:ketosteroid isomerase-like protein
MRCFTALGLVLCVTAAPALAQEKSETNSKAMHIADAVVKKVVDAYNSKNAATLAGLDTENAVYVGPDGKEVTGHPAIQQAIGNVIKAWGDFRFKGELKDARPFGPGIWALFDTSVDGNGPHGPIKISAHAVSLLMPVGKDWKIVLTSIGPSVPPPGM